MFCKKTKWAVVTPVYKTGYHLVPYHMRSSILFVLCPYSKLFVKYEHLFTHGQDVHLKTIFSGCIALFSS